MSLQSIALTLRAFAGTRRSHAWPRNVVLLTQPDMRAAQHLYHKAGFRRLPERDWSPRLGITLLAYGLKLNTGR